MAMDKKLKIALFGGGVLLFAGGTLYVIHRNKVSTKAKAARDAQDKADALKAAAKAAQDKADKDKADKLKQTQADAALLAAKLAQKKADDAAKAHADAVAAQQLKEKRDACKDPGVFTNGQCVRRDPTSTDELYQFSIDDAMGLVASANDLSQQQKLNMRMVIGRLKDDKDAKQQLLNDANLQGVPLPNVIYNAARLTIDESVEFGNIPGLRAVVKYLNDDRKIPITLVQAKPIAGLVMTFAGALKNPPSSVKDPATGKVWYNPLSDGSVSFIYDSKIYNSNAYRTFLKLQ